EGCRSLKSINIPQSLSDIGSGAFRSCTGLKSITLPENIVRIEKSAFEYCNALEKVVIQGDVYGIYQYAFRGCGSLTEFTFPETLTEIGELAFLGVPFSSLDLPASLTKIGKSAFYHCDSLTSVAIPGNVANIGANVFEGCGSLAAVTLSENIKSIPSGAFTGCTALDDVYYGGTVAQWNKTEKGENWNKDTGGCTVHCSDGDVYADDETLYYPEGVTEATPESYFVFTLLNDGTYSIKAKDVNDLPETVVIPAFYEGAKVTRVAYNGFCGCPGLKKVVVPSTVRYIQSEAFANCFDLGEFVLTDRSTSLFYNSLYQTAVYFDRNNWHSTGESEGFYLDDILVMAARGAGGGFEIRYGTKYISGGAFNNCKWYTSISIPDTVVSIGDSAFYGCASLESITVPEGVETIGVAAFQSTALQRVYLPSTLKKLGANAFALNDHLKDFYYAGTKEQWENVEKGKDWNDRVYFFDVHCSDGDVHYDY
ncbi:MAG: leucine-rich repeat domain-containing protein, partial [Clostridia bacterium]|nr:leucine-rich repeat domain-containing protein [Clostridia bacterium]